MSKFYDEQVELILRDIEHILRGDASRSHGVTITIEMKMGEIPTISYEIEEMRLNYENPVR